MAVDADWVLWTVNQCTNSLPRMNAKTGEVLGTFPVGENPEPFGRMTAVGQPGFCSCAGTYRHRFTKSGGPETLWASLDADVETGIESWLTVRVRAAGEEALLPVTEWQDSVNLSKPGGLPVNLASLPGMASKFLEVEFTLVPGSAPSLPRVDWFSVECK